MWLLFYGHDPDVVDRLSMRDVTLFLELLPIMQTLHSQRGFLDE